MSLTQEDFDNTVLDFAKAIVPAGNYGTDARKLIFEQARAYATAWYKDKDAQQKAFQNLIDDLGKDSETPNDPAAAQRKHYATAGKTVF